MAKKCEWNPSEHNGKPCPTHKGEDNEKLSRSQKDEKPDWWERDDDPVDISNQKPGVAVNKSDAFDDDYELEFEKAKDEEQKYQREMSKAQEETVKLNTQEKDEEFEEEKKSLASQLREVMRDNGYYGGGPDQSDEDWLDTFLQQDERRTGNYSNVRFKTFKDRADFYNPETNKNSSPEKLKNIYDFLVKNDEGLTKELNEIRDRKSNEYKKKKRESELDYWKRYFENIDEDMLDKVDNILGEKDFKSVHQKDVAKHEVLNALSILKKYGK